MNRRLIAGLAVAGLALTLGLTGCSSESDSAAAATDTTTAQGPAGPAAKPEAPVRVGVAEFAEVVAAPGTQIIDVRTPEEFAEGHIAGAVNIPVEYPDFMDRVSQLDPNATYAVYCRSGNRSQPAVAGMNEVGITGIYELDSGTTGWTGEGMSLVQ